MKIYIEQKPEDYDGHDISVTIRYKPSVRNEAVILQSHIYELQNRINLAATSQQEGGE